MTCYNMKIVPYKAGHIHLLSLKDEDKYLQDSPMFAQWATDNCIKDMSISIFKDDKCILCTGIRRMWTGVETAKAAEVWVIFSKKIPFLVLPIIRALKANLHRVIEEQGLTRVQAVVKANYTTAVKLVKLMGFEQESRMRKAEMDGTDSLMFTIIKEDKI